MPRLSDTEKQDIIGYLGADKPLPDKYRFLLFGDTREVELVWNGKTNEVTSVVLPFQTIEHVDEPRSENGGRRAKDAQSLMFDLDARARQLKGWTNKLIWGDNINQINDGFYGLALGEIVLEVDHRRFREDTSLCLRTEKQMRRVEPTSKNPERHPIFVTTDTKLLV